MLPKFLFPNLIFMACISAISFENKIRSIINYKIDTEICAFYVYKYT